MKTARIDLRLYPNEKQELSKLAFDEGKTLTSYILSKLGLESLPEKQDIHSKPKPRHIDPEFKIPITKIKDHPLQVVKTSRDNPHKTPHGLFYYNTGKVSLFRNHITINLQLKIAKMLKIQPGDSLFIYFDSDKKNLVMSIDNSISFEFECPVYQGSHSLVVILPKELIQELDFLPGIPILLYYFSVNDYFCCKKVSDLF